MSTEVVTQIEVNASPEACWKVLTDFAAYSQWNPVIPGISGSATVGAKSQMKIKLGPGPALPVPIKFVRVAQNQELAWRGGVDAVFAGEHYFRLEPGAAKGKTRLVHGEKFVGLVPRLAWTFVSGSIQKTYENLNRAFKVRVEKSA